MMERTTISIPRDLKESIEEYLKDVGLSWAEFLRNEVGYGPFSPSEKAILEAEASGTYEKNFTSTKEMFDDILGEGWDV